MSRLSSAKWLYNHLERTDNPLAYRINVAIALLVLLNITALILETVPEYQPYQVYFDAFEAVSVVLFTLEYLLRVYAAAAAPNAASPLRGSVQYLLSPFALADVIALLPFYLAFIPLDLRILRIFRLFRVLLLLKLVRYSKSIRILMLIYHEKKQELATALFGMLALLVTASCIMYYLEHDAQPEVFVSIPHTMWWGIATLTTVGYGDIYPVTLLGKILGAMIAVLGIGTFALPAAILSASFAEHLLSEPKVTAASCPKCGYHEELG